MSHLEKDGTGTYSDSLIVIDAEHINVLVSPSERKIWVCADGQSVLRAQASVRVTVDNGVVQELRDILDNVSMKPTARARILRWLEKLTMG